MARMTIIVSRGGAGGPLVRVTLRSDADALPCEHEAHHARLVAALLPGCRAEREKPAVEPRVG
jgi:hypothetical protein